MLNSMRIKIAAIASVAALGVGTGIGVTASAATTAPPAGNLYGCITSTRTIANAYTSEKNFVSFLNAHGGKCPSGFPFSVVSGQNAPTPTPTATSPTPTPTATTPTPTPTPTGAPKCVLSTLDRSTCGPYPTATIKGSSVDQGPSLRQEVWNPQPALRKQVLTAWSPSNWQVVENAAAGNTEVNSYPDVSNDVSADVSIPISSYHSLTSTYSENMHANAGTDAEAAYDIWLPGGNELMIWVDNHGQTPGGDDTGKNITAGGNTYRVWKGDGAVSLVLDHNAQSGTTDLLGIFKALIAMGIYSSNVAVDQINFGFEAPSTGGVDETFSVTNYTLQYS